MTVAVPVSELNIRRQLRGCGNDAADSATARCAVFGICGGCGLQQRDGAAQLFDKQALLRQQLREIGGYAPEAYRLLPAVAGPRWNYRRRARLAVRWVPRKNAVLVGFRERRGRYVTDALDCEILAPGLAELIRPLRVLLRSLDSRESLPQIEAVVGESPDDPARPEVALILRHLAPLSPEDRQRLLAFAACWRLQLYLQPAGLGSVQRLYPRHGPERLYQHLPGFNQRLAFHPLDFLQINAAVNRRAISLVLELLALQQSDRLLDLFCGIGNFTLPAASRCAEAVGVELGLDLVARAGENARANKVENAGFHRADLYRRPIEAKWAKRGYSKVLLDPPRTGALESLPLIAATGARRLVYVSCNPASLARDARELCRLGYDLKSAGVMDMFPHTSHVESVAVFEPSPRAVG